MRRKSSITIILIVGVLFVVGVLVAVFYMRNTKGDSKSAVVQTNQTTESASTTPSTQGQSQVCTAADITTYNTTVAVNSSETAAKAQQTLASLAKSIASRKNNEQDPTCQYILWQYAYLIGDQTGQTNHVDKLTTLNENNVYVDPSVKGLRSTDELKGLTTQSQEDAVKRGEG